jgi:hypothetical protein
MRSLGGLALILACLGVISGCATTRYPSAYKVEGREFREFKELDDEQALKAVVLIYNVKQEDWEGGIARSLALDYYLSLLKKRRSAYIENSGIFAMQYDKVKLSSWKDEDLVKLYDALAPRTDPYYMDSAHELTEMQNAERIVCLTALASTEKELRRRDNNRNTTALAGQVILAILTIALQLI